MREERKGGAGVITPEIEQTDDYKGGSKEAAPEPEEKSSNLGDQPQHSMAEILQMSMHETFALTPSQNSLVFDKDAIKTVSDEVSPVAGLNANITSSPAEKMSAFEQLFDKRLSDCGWFLQQKLLEVLPLRSQNTGNQARSSLFPLPTSRSCLVAVLGEIEDGEMAWMTNLCISLNSVWGGCLFSDSPASALQASSLRLLFKDVERLCKMDATIEELSWKEFMKIRSVDYKGEEVKVARQFSWKNISPALPLEVGRVPLEEVCSYGSKHYVLNFDHYLKPKHEWKFCKAPRVMVDDLEWPAVCSGLVSSGVCTFIEEADVFDTGQGPLLNGLFGVTKEDWTSEGVEIFRLIMNLIPLNHLCMPMAGDVNTLPSWGGMSPFFLQPHEVLLVTSEDVKCFFYTMRVPPCWVKFLAFNKLVPDSVLPPELAGRRVYLASVVLPMGFLNSVSLAQHVHRNLVLWSNLVASDPNVNAPPLELRKDQPFSAGNPTWRVYLDNYDLLEKVEATAMVDLEGSTPPGVLALRQQYEVWDVPRNLKKAVTRSSKSEVQGATVDGVAGVAYPREGKLARYFSLALQLCIKSTASQKEWQVVCGGLVYFSMFRRPLLGCLNRVWSHVESFNAPGAWSRPSPPDCRLEVLRMLGLLPLARMDFRLGMHPQVTCSDASSEGGGACVSSALTAFGVQVTQGSLRGELVESRTEHGILTVGLFDGIGALRVSMEALGVQVLGHISVEKHEPAQRVVESHYPGTVVVPDVTLVDSDMVRQWSTMFSQCSLVVLGGGPPCQGVSGLNCDRKGALKDQRSNLFVHVPRIVGLLRQFFPWCPVHYLMESVRSMDSPDREIMSEAIGSHPVVCDSGSFTWCHRPRLYWTSWEFVADENAWFDTCDDGVSEIHLEGNQPLEQVIRGGWLKFTPTKSFPTFTTSRPRLQPGRKPAGLQHCRPYEVERWKADQHRFPPYQYTDDNCLVNKQGLFRIPDIAEREVMMGFPLHYTAPCTNKSGRKAADYNDTRLTLLGNSWSVPVVSWMVGQLCWQLGLCPRMSPQDILDALVPGGTVTTQGRLTRLPLNPGRSVAPEDMGKLAFQLGNLISMKGEDIMLTTPSSQMVKHHRLRASVPGKLWRWRIVSGWRWRHGREHINSLELRAIMTTLRWRLEHQRHFNTRFIHLTDSLVCLHCLTRGRSSSRKLRRTMSRVNALILASNTQPVWGYIDTHQNPADKPSRWGQRVRTKFRNAAKTRV